MIDKELKQKVINLRKEGKTFKEIKEITCLAKSSISDICRPYGLGGNPINKLSEDDLKEAQRLYDEIGSIKKVGKILHISFNRLSKLIVKDTTKKTANKSDAVINWRKRKKKELVDYKGGKCQICGYDKCIESLEFHHLDPYKKDFSISGKSLSFEKLKSEADKCILVCANCHREIHSGLVRSEDYIEIKLKDSTKES